MTQTAIPRPVPLALLVILQAVVSAASLVVEIVAGRMLAPYLGMSIYTWTSIIAVVLAGFSAGHWAGGRIAMRRTDRALMLTAWSMAGAALTTAAAIFILRWTAGGVISFLDQPLAAIVVLTTLAFFMPSFFAGIPAPVLAQVAVTDAQRQDRDSGPALGAMFASGALGAIFGTLAAGFLFIAWLGSVRTMALVAVIYVATALVLWFMARTQAGSTSTRNGGMAASGVLLAVTGAATGLTAHASLAMPDPCTRESQYFCIRVIDDEAQTGEPSRVMVLDNLVHGISVQDDPDRMATIHGFMLEGLARERMAGRPFSAFFIGGGSFTIPRAWTQGKTRADVTVAEIDPAVTDVAASDYWLDPGQMRVLDRDARLVLRREDERYDVIVGDAFTDIAVPPHLITHEFFELLRARLTEDGVYLMNVIDHVDRLEALAAITRTLRQVFPTVEVWASLEPPAPGERAVFILAAGFTPTGFSRLEGGAPDFHRAGRLSDSAVDAMLTRLSVPVLTDDYAPIDRLMGRLD